MKNIKFKVLIMFMLLVLVGLGSSSVFAETEEYLKTSDLYKFDSGWRYIFYGPDGDKEHIPNDVKWKTTFEQQVLNKVVEIGGVEYIKYADWVMYWADTQNMENMGISYKQKEWVNEFARGYYEFMTKYKYTTKRAGGSRTFEALLDATIYKEMQQYSDDSKGIVIINKYMEANQENVYDYLGNGKDKVKELYDKLWAYLIGNAFIHVYHDYATYNNQTSNFFAKWGDSSSYINNYKQDIYMEYYKTLKVSIDVPDSNPTPEPEKNPQDYEEGINNFWENAFDWFKGAQASGGMGTVTDGFMKGATNIIKMVGNMIFIVVTSILGVKYIWGSADAKYSVKNSLFSLVIAAVVFYGWDSISNIIQTVTTSTVGNNIESTTRTIYTYILYFVNIAAIGGIIFLGVKYLLASAEGKSQLKMNMGPAFLGIIMVYATISFLNTILSIFLG